MKGVGCRLSVQRRMPERTRIDGVHGLAQVEMEVLCRPASTPVKADCGHRAGQERDADARAEAVTGGRIGSCPANETEAPTSERDRPTP